jgi:protein involved in polysaccharide export with SLBB domain
MNEARMSATPAAYAIHTTGRQPARTPRFSFAPSLFIAAAAASLMLSGCSEPVKSDAASQAQAPEPIPFRLGIGDDVSVKFYYTPELNEHQPIRPDGKISMPLIDDVQAAGLTVDELRAQLRAAYAKHLKDPELEVVIDLLASARIFVGGEVNLAGAQPLVGGTTVSRAIMAAQGFKPTAYTKEVIVVHTGADGRSVVHQVNVDKVLDGSDPRGDMLLGSQDVVFVPRSPIANADTFVEQYIRQLLPFSTNMSYNINSYKP